MTPRKLRKLWREYNEAVFSGVLFPPARIRYEPTPEEVTDVLGPVYGYCDGMSLGKVWIGIDPRCDTEQSIRDTLLHEMVHQYQHQMGIEMLHDASFEAWRSPIKRITGCDI